jgi:hypothetical protein
VDDLPLRRRLGESNLGTDGKGEQELQHPETGWLVESGAAAGYARRTEALARRAARADVDLAPAGGRGADGERR